MPTYGDGPFCGAGPVRHHPGGSASSEICEKAASSGSRFSVTM